MRRDNQNALVVEECEYCIIAKNVLCSCSVWEMVFLLFCARDWAKYVASVLAPTPRLQGHQSQSGPFDILLSLVVPWRVGLSGNGLCIIYQIVRQQLLGEQTDRTLMQYQWITMRMIQLG